MTWLMMDIPKQVIQLQINIKYLGGDVRVSVKCTDTSDSYQEVRSTNQTEEQSFSF